MSFDPTAGTLRCPFCGSEELLQQPSTKTLLPEAVVPFRVEKDQALEVLDKWLGQGFWRPSDLAGQAIVSNMTPVYVPYWVFRARTHTYWTADSSHTPFGANASWYPMTGEHHGQYEGLLVAASGVLSPKETNSIAPLDLSAAVDPGEIDLTHATVEQFGTPRKYARPLARQGLEELEADACHGLVPGSCRNLHVNVRVSGLSSVPMLLPVWVMAYRYKNQVYRFLLNGQTGKATGHAPISTTKVSAAVVIGIAVVAVIVLLAMWLSGG